MIEVNSILRIIKKKIVLLFLLLFSSFLFIDCSTSNEISKEDRLLQQKIIGTWHSKNYETIRFEEYGTFIDTVFIPVALDKLIYIPEYIVKGNYFVKDGSVNFTNPAFTYLNIEADTSISFNKIIFYSRTIRFEGKDLFLQEIPVLETEVSHKTLTGKWEMITPVSTYERTSNRKFKTGLLKEIYQFHQDSSIVNYKNDFLFETEYPEDNILTEFTYNDKRLFFNSTQLEVKSFLGAFVVFENNKMIWYQSDPVYYKRIEY